MLGAIAVIWTTESGTVEKVPNIIVEPPGPKAKKIIEMDNEFLATSTKSAPIAVESASGAVIHDVDGNSMLDFASGVAVLNIGHCHPKVVKAVQEQAAKLMHFAGTDYYYDIQSELAKRLCKVGPGHYKKKVFFSNSGTESIEAAIKLVRWNRPERKQIIAFIGAFHGRTMGSLSLTASKRVQRERYTPSDPRRHPHPLRLLLSMSLSSGISVLQHLVCRHPQGGIFRDHHAAIRGGGTVHGAGPGRGRVHRAPGGLGEEDPRHHQQGGHPSGGR